MIEAFAAGGLSCKRLFSLLYRSGDNAFRPTSVQWILPEENSYITAQHSAQERLCSRHAHFCLSMSCWKTGDSDWPTADTAYCLTPRKLHECLREVYP